MFCSWALLQSSLSNIKLTGANTRKPCCRRIMAFYVLVLEPGSLQPWLFVLRSFPRFGNCPYVYGSWHLAHNSAQHWADRGGKPLFARAILRA